eukprot:COSAG01_NODE_596_length_15055_cov_17.624967_11_plen_90_part_00
MFVGLHVLECVVGQLIHMGLQALPRRTFQACTQRKRSAPPPKNTHPPTSLADEWKYFSTIAGEKIGSALYGLTAIKIGPMYVCMRSYQS